MLQPRETRVHDAHCFSMFELGNPESMVLRWGVVKLLLTRNAVNLACACESFLWLLNHQFLGLQKVGHKVGHPPGECFAKLWDSIPETDVAGECLCLSYCHDCLQHWHWQNFKFCCLLVSTPASKPIFC